MLRRHPRMRRRLLSGAVAVAAVATLTVAVAPGAAATGKHGCGQVVVKHGGRTFVADRYEAVHGVGCKTVRLMTRRFLEQGHGPTACAGVYGCRVAYRWLCFYEGFHDRYGYEHDCFQYPHYPAVGFPAQPGAGFFFSERVR
jgi:hypothetical protein